MKKIYKTIRIYYRMGIFSSKDIVKNEKELEEVIKKLDALKEPSPILTVDIPLKDPKELWNNRLSPVESTKLKKKRKRKRKN